MEWTKAWIQVFLWDPGSLVYLFSTLRKLRNSVQHQNTVEILWQGQELILMDKSKAVAAAHAAAVFYCCCWAASFPAPSLFLSLCLFYLFFFILLPVTDALRCQSQRGYFHKLFSVVVFRWIIAFSSNWFTTSQRQERNLHGASHQLALGRMFLIFLQLFFGDKLKTTHGETESVQTWHLSSWK